MESRLVAIDGPVMIRLIFPNGFPTVSSLTRRAGRASAEAAAIDGSRQAQNVDCLVRTYGPKDENDKNGDDTPVSVPNNHRAPAADDIA